MSLIKFLFRLAFVCGALLPVCGFSHAADPENPIEEPEHARIYRNPEERREAGLGTQITDWLSVSGLLEIERERSDQFYSNNIDFTDDPGSVYTLQLGLDLEFSESVAAEVVFESEHNKKRTHSMVDEALLAASFEPWGFEAGRLYVPFGEYYSHFVTGPLLEFGETRADAIVVDYTIADAVEIAAYVFDGNVAEPNKSRSTDWGINFDYSSEDESVRLGVGYLSDLAESDERFLSEFANVSERAVPAWNAYALFGSYPYEVTAEIVKAAKTFVEFDEQENSPSAYNVEFAYFPVPTTQFAIRFEGSDEFSEEPENQWGVNFTWRPNDLMSLSLDYLKGRYRNGFVVDDDDNELRDQNEIAFQLAVEF